MDSSTIHVAELARGNLRSIIAHHLLLGILQGEFPAGDRLIVQKLSKKFSISATPVREALFELESIGMVESRPNRGAIVRPFGRQELHDLYQLRRILQLEAVRCASREITHQALTDYKARLVATLYAPISDQWHDSMLALDHELHVLVADNCGNKRLAKELDRYEVIIQAFREMAGRQNLVMKLMGEQHLEIVEALLVSDPERAARAESHHLSSIVPILEDSLFNTNQFTNLPPA